jgi:hypothetical protein
MSGAGRPVALKPRTRPRGPAGSEPRRMLQPRKLPHADLPGHTLQSKPAWWRARSGVVYGLVAPYLLLVAVHVACGWPIQQPSIFADELGYLGHARYLSGTGVFPYMGTATYYHFGYSLLLLPAFWLFDDPFQTYRAVMVTNALLISLLYFPVRHVLHAGLGTPRDRATAIALVTCLYPAFVLQSNYAWAENAVIPGYAALVAVFWRVVNRPSYRAALCLGLLGAFLYTVHPRALCLVPLIVVVLVGLTALRVLRWGPATAGIVCVGLIFLGTTLANDHLHPIGWNYGHEAFPAGRIAGRVFTLPYEVLLTTAGQLLYLAQSTYGISLMGPLYMCALAWTQGFRVTLARYDKRQLLLLAFVLITSGGLLATSALAAATGGSRGDHVIYGRYNEGFLALHVALGLALLCTIRPGRARTLAIYGTIAAVAAFTGIVLATRADLLTRHFVGANIFGIYPAVRLLGGIHLATTSTVSAGVFIGVTWVFRRSSLAGLTAVACCFLAGAAYGYQEYCRPSTRAQKQSDLLRSRITDLGVTSLSVDWDDRSVATYYLNQYLLPHTRVNAFKSADGGRPASTAVISDRYWPAAESLRARLVVAAPRTNRALWLLPGAEHYDSATQSFMEVRLGWRRFPGVFESGFSRTEGRGTSAFRWTNGAGRVVVPLSPGGKPARLGVTLAYPTRKDLRLVVNDSEVFAGHLGAGVERTFDLSTVAATDWLTIHLLSDTFVPDDVETGTRDRGRSGVAVRSIRLLRQ